LLSVGIRLVAVSNLLSFHHRVKSLIFWLLVCNSPVTLKVRERERGCIYEWVSNVTPHSLFYSSHLYTTYLHTYTVDLLVYILSWPTKPF
jgi:hypothetical protein